VQQLPSLYPQKEAGKGPALGGCWEWKEATPEKGSAAWFVVHRDKGRVSRGEGFLGEVTEASMLTGGSDADWTGWQSLWPALPEPGWPSVEF
jgi:hypothetical protein